MYTQCSQPVNFNTEISILEHHLPVINQCLIPTPQNRALPSVSKNRQIPSVQTTHNSSSTLRTMLRTGYQPYNTPVTLRLIEQYFYLVTDYP